MLGCLLLLSGCQVMGVLLPIVGRMSCGPAACPEPRVCPICASWCYPAGMTRNSQQLLPSGERASLLVNLGGLPSDMWLLAKPMWCDGAVVHTFCTNEFS